ncbi:GNAT family N-acetyltransferase [Kitasatospora sp. NPDC059571]|uniref:GNAT family N-acetyltransferase n=1 Tax=Kitasatospora sp. NPDC059571 TaxID=3346871 RepID=UPI0036AB35AF
MVTLRVLSTNDWLLWRQARLASLTEAPYAFTSRREDWEHGGERRWRARLALPDAHNVVAVLDGRAVGLAAGMTGEGGVRQLRSVWVGPAVRGRGVGDRLVAAVGSWARRTGGTSLELAVLPGNDAAVALYRRHGFVATGEPGALLADGVSRELLMAKPLN